MCICHSLAVFAYFTISFAIPNRSHSAAWSVWKYSLYLETNTGTNHVQKVFVKNQVFLPNLQAWKTCIAYLGWV